MAECLKRQWLSGLRRNIDVPECGQCAVCLAKPPAAPETPTDIEALRDEARSLGVKRAGTMGEDRLRDEIAHARAEHEAEGDEPDLTEENQP